MDWIFLSPQNSYVEIIIPNVKMLEVGPLEKIRSWSGTNSFWTCSGPVTLFNFSLLQGEHVSISNLSHHCILEVYNKFDFTGLQLKESSLPQNEIYLSFIHLQFSSFLSDTLYLGFKIDSGIVKTFVAIGMNECILHGRRYEFWGWLRGNAMYCAPLFLYWNPNPFRTWLCCKCGVLKNGISALMIESLWKELLHHIWQERPQHKDRHLWTRYWFCQHLDLLLLRL